MFASHFFLLCTTYLAVCQAACSFTVCLFGSLSACLFTVFFSHLLGSLNLSICLLSLCLVNQLSSLVEANLPLLFIHPDPGLQRAVRQVCISQ